VRRSVIAATPWLRCPPSRLCCLLPPPLRQGGPQAAPTAIVRESTPTLIPTEWRRF
jgi:hypothetical protein